MLKSWKFWLGCVLLIGLIWLVDSQYGWNHVLASWKDIPPFELSIAILLMLFSYLLRAIRFHDFFIAHTRGHFLALLRVTVLHNFFNNLLPMRSGETAFPLMMKTQFGLSYGHSTPALLWLRLLDLYVLLALAFISLQSIMPFATEIRVVLAVTVLAAPLLALPLQETIRRWLSNRDSGWRTKAKDLMTALPASPYVFVRALFWTLLNWILKLAVYAWLLQVFTGLKFFQSWTGATTGELSSVLPIHGVAGAGTYEAGVLAGLIPWGVDNGTALSAAVNLHLFVLGTTLLLTALLILVTLNAQGHAGKIENTSEQ